MRETDLQVQLLALSLGVARADTNLRALEASRNAMVLSEAALGDATSLLQQAREGALAVSRMAAGGAGFGHWERWWS